MALVEDAQPKECDIYEVEELKLTESHSPGESSEFREGDVREQISALLKVDGRGWNVSIFQNRKRLPICPHCKHVCRDAVELGKSLITFLVLLYDFE